MWLCEVLCFLHRLRRVLILPWKMYVKRYQGFCMGSLVMLWHVRFNFQILSHVVNGNPQQLQKLVRKRKSVVYSGCTQPGMEQGAPGRHSKINTSAHLDPNTKARWNSDGQNRKGTQRLNSYKYQKKKPHTNQMVQKNLFNLKIHFPGLVNSQPLPILSVPFPNKSQHFLQSEIIDNRFW